MEQETGKVNVVEIVLANVDRPAAEIEQLVHERGGQITRGYIYALKSKFKKEKGARVHQRPKRRRPLRIICHRPRPAGGKSDMLATLDAAIAKAEARLDALKKARAAVESIDF